MSGPGHGAVPETRSRDPSLTDPRGQPAVPTFPDAVDTRGEGKVRSTKYGVLIRTDLQNSI